MNPNKTIMNEKLLRLKDVLERLPISKSAWYAGVGRNEFPQPVRIGTRTVAWLESDIENYLRRNYGGPGKAAN